jgi:hypothetical protein
MGTQSIMFSNCKFIHLFSAVLGVELMLARQVFYHLSSAASPFLLWLLLR